MILRISHSKVPTYFRTGPEHPTSNIERPTSNEGRTTDDPDEHGFLNAETRREKRGLTFLSEFTGAEWPAFLNHVSHLVYRPVSMAVNN
jgi:hypothetical protein